MNWELHQLLGLNAPTFLATIVLTILMASAGIVLYLVSQRGIRRLRVRRYEALAFEIHKQWREIVRGEVPPEVWRKDAVKGEIIRSIVIQEIGATTDKDRASLQEFLRNNGLVETCIGSVHRERGLKRRRAMLALGAMRIPEAIAPLAEGLDDWQLDTRMAAIQALGATGLPAAAAPIIESLMVGALKLPASPVEIALVQCFADHAGDLMPYLRRSLGGAREMLARVAAEIATASMADEMMVLSKDLDPEIRACAARALAMAPLTIAIPMLADLVRDEIWFVRLRATSSLKDIFHPRTIPILLDAVRDPNRQVRIRAASALSSFERDRVLILQTVVDSRDRYALHSIISALELSGGLSKIMEELSDPLLHDEAAERLLTAIREGIASLWSTRPESPVVETVFP